MAVIPKKAFFSAAEDLADICKQISLAPKKAKLNAVLQSNYSAGCEKVMEMRSIIRSAITGYKQDMEKACTLFEDVFKNICEAAVENDASEAHQEYLTFMALLKMTKAEAKFWR